jgi:hypothetical protein
MMSNYDVANQTLKDALANTTDPQSMIAIQKEQKRLQTLKKEHREMSLPTGAHHSDIISYISVMISIE